jgi:hypothetical protein
MLKKQFLPTCQLRRIFNQSKDNKNKPFVNISSVETQNFNQAMKSSNRWAVDLWIKKKKYKSFSEKNDCLFLERREKIPS